MTPAILCDRLFVAMATVLILKASAYAAPIDPGDIRVIDGDTLRIYQKQPNVRLVGFNAPETRRAQCEAERELGGRARARCATSCAPAISTSNTSVE
jgi:endonuclease YncB( thermonuclease family)